MYISVMDMFKIGIGPSSSHTLGPMKAGLAFIDELKALGRTEDVTDIRVKLYGSLSLTGKGHATDQAVTLGLAGFQPETVDIDEYPRFLAKVEETGKLPIAGGLHTVSFPAGEAVVFNRDSLPLHENGMTITAYQGQRYVLSKTYYSIGGGFITDEEHFGKDSTEVIPVPYEFDSAEELLEICERENLTIPQVIWANENALRPEEETRAHMAKVWAVMKEGIERGTTTEGVLPGPMQLPRRAALLRQRLESDSFQAELPVMSWLNAFALAVNEENAAGGRVVTSPTNGACGILPAVLAYYIKFRTIPEEQLEGVLADYFLACSAIGSLYKKNASISGAEVGCQGEVGVACSMAAGGLAQLLGGSPAQVFTAAEIAMEHKLGLTCDPVGGQVQIPCIERNAIGAVDAVSAANMALQRESQPSVNFDEVVHTMYCTGRDMRERYRETSLGGLALVVKQQPATTKPLPCW
ncbi:L-serine ammonia-lyase [Corynebacterium sp.]|uniref:L-serine ammonia-lyase n=1 Tax=Corynebacterium sp. TaxID=1720 RepID=UPI0026DBCBAB|nr:L-serine ammonia-lyase [Corynebacterium sp.]MDO5033101.1 L-serine ammonia-lyase [Corynebacterium sp.]